MANPFGLESNGTQHVDSVPPDWCAVVTPVRGCIARIHISYHKGTEGHVSEEKRFAFYTEESVKPKNFKSPALVAQALRIRYTDEARGARQGKEQHEATGKQ